LNLQIKKGGFGLEAGYCPPTWRHGDVAAGRSPPLNE
jgi:hypothetical protein